MIEVARPGIQSNKFLDIESLEHRFPSSLRGLGIPVTLLHNHGHCPADYVLVYTDDYSVSTYTPRQEAEQKYHPCSWYLDDKEAVAYEFCDMEIPADMEVILRNLEVLESQGFSHYGTTLRPILKVMELETQTGHVYQPMGDLKMEGKCRYSETSMNGLEADWCINYCFNINGRHVR